MPSVVALAGLGALGFEHNRARPVAEQHTGGAVVPVEDAREGLGADDQRPLVLSGFEETIGGGQRIDKARAHRLHVEGRALGRAQRSLDRHSGCRKGLVGRRGGQDDEIDVLRVDLRCLQRPLRCGDGKVGSQFAVGGDVALPDAGALDDPVIARVDEFGEFRVGEDLLGEIGAASAND